jgi:hypothetical protein
MHDAAVEREHKLRLLLREYELLLRQYSEGSLADESELNSRMQTLLSMQLDRLETFDKRLSAKSEWGFLGVDNSALVGKAHVLRSDLNALPTFENLPRYDTPFVEERRFCYYAISRIEQTLKDRGVKQDADPVATIASQIRNRIDTEARLRRQCEEDVQKYPDQEESIRRGYRHAIDAVREQG